ncbi:hypothetical protein JOD54_002479 [Actinokineospora baliensis]|uniref:hypothetical protein n=1 Tax=Actinokineospora baliensis TaxID=547056 RepID=UPI001956E0E0|nr:hypothetical protein [Actinokineospora baliensis]MBM7772275.1 hypothetical protein [Actinokineospora baliensis]
MGTEREERRPDPARARPAAAPDGQHALVGLQRSAGNKAVADMVTVSRRVTPPPAPVTRPPVVQPRAGAGPAVMTPNGAPRYAAPPDYTIDEFDRRLTSAGTREAAIWEGERPIATVAGGGSAPGFVVERGWAKTSVAFEGGSEGNVTVHHRLRSFDVLGALAHDASKVSSEADLASVHAVYFPDSLVTELPAGPSIPTALDDVTIIYSPRAIDPGGGARFPVLAAALRKRAQTLPEMSGWAMMKAIAGMDLDLAAAPAERKGGPCLQKPVPRQGGNAQHNAFADKVTGSMTDYYLRTPEGLETTTDGLDATDPKLVWEVKTRHEWATEAGLAGGSLFSPLIHREFIYKLEAQLARHIAVTSRCDMKLAYAVDDPTLADFLRKHWGNSPPIHHR